MTILDQAYSIFDSGFDCTDKTIEDVMDEIMTCLADVEIDDEGQVNGEFFNAEEKELAENLWDAYAAFEEERCRRLS